MFSLRSSITVKVLGYFFINPLQKRYLHELAKILQVDPSNLDKKLKELEFEGMVKSEKQGIQKYYSLNKQYPLLQEVQKMYEQKYSIKEKLAHVLKNVKGIQHIYIFGSFAKNNIQQESDIDILIIGTHSIREVQRKIVDLQNELQREFNIIHISEKELEQKRKDKDPFMENIFNNPLIQIM